jgi:hypothetical protein
MGRAYDFTVVGVVWIIDLTVHLISVQLFAPDGTLYQIATDGTENLNGADHANIWFQWLAVYMPLTVGAGILAWAFMREYRRQIGTATPQARPPR